MKSKTLEITKENYKGYLEYYRLKKEPLTLSQEIIEVLLKFSSFLLAITFVVFFMIRYAASIEEPLVVLFSTSFASSLVLASDMKKIFKSKELKQIKKEYPYINLNEKELDIEKALEKVNKGKSTKDVKKWENYYGCEEIKKETLSNKNGEYKSYIYEPIKPEISSEEVKQKVKVLTKAKRL